MGRVDIEGDTVRALIVTEHTDAKFTHGICPTCLEAAKAEFTREDSLLNEPPRVR